MFNLQKAGGISALFAAAAYVFGFAVMATLLNPGNTSGWSWAAFRSTAARTPP